MKKILLSITLLAALNLLFVTYEIKKCNEIIVNQQKSNENLQENINNATNYLNKYFKY